MKVFSLAVFALTYLPYFVHSGTQQFRTDLNPHAGVPEECPRSMQHIKHQLQEVKCMPRKSLERLNPEPGFYFLPEVVTVHRCGGMCTNSLSCLPEETKNRSILVRRYHIDSSSDFQCYKVYVEEHVKCSCECNILAEHCNKNQIYNDNDCACECYNMEEQRECRKRKKMGWNSETCKCTCLVPEEECSTGLEWIPSICRCGKVMPMHSSG